MNRFAVFTQTVEGDRRDTDCIQCSILSPSTLCIPGVNESNPATVERRKRSVVLSVVDAWTNLLAKAVAKL